MSQYRPGLLTPNGRAVSLSLTRFRLAAGLVIPGLVAVCLTGPARGAAPADAAAKPKPAASAAQPKPAEAPKAKPADGKKGKPKPVDPAKAKQRADAVEGLAKRLGVGPGAAVADIGAGNGTDSWTFARLVGDKGTVYSEEVGEGQVKTLTSEAEKRKLPQVRAVLGRDDDPGLPAGAVDLAYMHFVYHHFAQPREMLHGLWRSLKPGGHLVIVDQRKGTLREWVPNAERKAKHTWTAETAVVRQARECGFAFVSCDDSAWFEKEAFVLVFQRPRDAREPGADPDPFLPLAVSDKAALFLPLARPYARPVFIALGEARGLIAPILARSSGPGLEIVLEEWALQKDERPPLPAKVTLPAVLTEQGDPRLGPEPIDAVFFLDSYHRLFHGATLLAKLRERLAPQGCIYVLDRVAKSPLSRREASHRRRIAPDTVQHEMTAARLPLWFTAPPPAADRFLLVFGKTAAGELKPAFDPFFGGPELPPSPAAWLTGNAWRLRGFQTADGRAIARQHPGQALSAESVAAATPGRTAWRVPEERLILSFDPHNGVQRLIDCRPEPGSR